LDARVAMMARRTRSPGFRIFCQGASGLSPATLTGFHELRQVMLTARMGWDILSGNSFNVLLDESKEE